MYKYILEQAGQINWMAIFSLMTFFFVFTLSILLAFKKNDDQIKHMASIPLEDNEINESPTE